MIVMKTGIDLIAAERKRQVDVEGYTPEHDDQHDDGALALVAALYATPQQLFSVSVTDDRKHNEAGYRGITLEADDPWPCEWNKKYDKRGSVSRVHQLTIAGALIAAEIDRLLRTDITKENMVRRVSEVMKKAGRCDEEVAFEKENIASWWDACQEDDMESLKYKEDFVTTNISRAENSADDSGYVECRKLFLDVVKHWQKCGIPF